MGFSDLGALIILGPCAVGLLAHPHRRPWYWHALKIHCDRIMIYKLHENEYGKFKDMFSNKQGLDDLMSRSNLSNILPVPRDMTRIAVCFVVVKIESLVSSGISEKKLNEAECYKSEFRGMLMQLIFPGFCSPIVHVI